MYKQPVACIQFLETGEGRCFELIKEGKRKKKMLESRPEDALVKLVKLVNLVNH